MTGSSRLLPSRVVATVASSLASLLLGLVAWAGAAGSEGPIEVLHSFRGTDGAWSRGSLRREGTTLYGRTAIGGRFDRGTVFSIEEDGSGFASVYSFTRGGDNGLGNQPHHNSMLAAGDTLIGAALYGGNTKHDTPDRRTGDITPEDSPPTEKTGNGTIFRIDRDGSDYAVLLELEGGPHSPSLPHSPPVLAPDGKTLYGMTSAGGAAGTGTLYRVATDGSGFRLLYSFVEESGYEPHGLVTFDRKGNLLGLTRKGGSPPSGEGGGVVFRWDVASESYEVLHTFEAGSRTNGDTNDHGFLVLIDGVAYATTERGGVHLRGTVFAIDEDGSDFRILHSFGAPGDGAAPYGSLLQVGDWLYGTTTAGGATGDGTLFRARAGGGGYERLASFDRRTSGAFPEDCLVASLDGRSLFGLTQAGGAFDPDAKGYFGTVFRFAIPP